MTASARKNAKRSRKNAAKIDKSLPADVTRMPESPTPERMQKDSEFGGVVRNFVAENPKSLDKTVTYRASVECWLDRYKRKGLLDDVECAAGIMFRHAWMARIHGIGPYVQPEIGYASGGNYDFEDAIDNLRGAERIVSVCLKKLSPMQKVAVTTCCGQDEALGSTARIRTLRRALECISRKSRLVTESDNNFLARQLERFL